MGNRSKKGLDAARALHVAPIDPKQKEGADQENQEESTRLPEQHPIRPVPVALGHHCGDPHGGLQLSDPRRLPLNEQHPPRPQNAECRYPENMGRKHVAQLAFGGIDDAISPTFHRVRFQTFKALAKASTRRSRCSSVCAVERNDTS